MKLLTVALFVFLATGCSGSKEEQPGSVADSSAYNTGLELPETPDPVVTLPSPTMIDYVDPQVGYEAQVPEGWLRVTLEHPDEVGFTVSFESPQASAEDSFSDYLMVEILPGQSPEGFSTPADERTPMLIEGTEVFRERVVLDGYPVADTTIDLVAWQLKMVQPDYSIGIYVVGEHADAARLERILVEFAYSFVLPESPFRVASLSFFD